MGRIACDKRDAQKSRKPEMGCSTASVGFGWFGASSDDRGVQNTASTQQIVNDGGREPTGRPTPRNGRPLGIEISPSGRAKPFDVARKSVGTRSATGARKARGGSVSDTPGMLDSRNA